MQFVSHDDVLVQPWWRQPTWTESSSCWSLCTLLAFLRRGHPRLREIERRIAAFLRPQYLAATSAGGDGILLERDSCAVCSSRYFDYYAYLAFSPYDQTFSVTLERMETLNGFLERMVLKPCTFENASDVTYKIIATTWFMCEAASMS